MVTHDQEEALSMADTVVVMNHGRIEQVGTPQQIYRDPASAFVADFVGKVNVLSAVAEGAGRFRVGGLVLTGAIGSESVAAGTPVKLYLRPEDVLVDGAVRDRPNAVPGKVLKVEFLGAFCLVTVTLAGAGDQCDEGVSMPRRRPEPTQWIDAGGLVSEEYHQGHPGLRGSPGEYHRVGDSLYREACVLEQQTDHPGQVFVRQP